LNGLGVDNLEPLIQVALKSDNPQFRSSAREVLVRIDPDAGLQALSDAVDSGTRGERQSAVQLLANQQGNAWAPLKRELVNRLLVGDVPDDMLLEVLEMATASDDARIQEGLAVFESRRDDADPLSKYRESLAGGDIELGRSIFLDRRDLSCKRCHLIGEDGGNVGPELTHIAKDKDPKYLLESVVTPNKAIAEGFETLLVVTIDGVVLSGIVKHQDDDEIRLMTPEGETLTISMDDVEETQRGDSSMPADLIEQLNKRELRDLLAFLNSLK
jgi:quinoprotein glucose dehydrogenase